MIYHDHLNIWWDKATQAYLKTLKCPIEGWEDRTWYDRQLRIMGETNNSKVVKRYQNKVVGDTPEGQVLDCHLFAQIKEVAGMNVVMTCHLNDKDDAKYSFATPEDTFLALENTIKDGEWDEVTEKDWLRIWDVDRDDMTWKRIIEADGTYIEDSGKRIRSGVRRQLECAARADAREKVKLKASKKAEAKFLEMHKKLAQGGGFGEAQWMKNLTHVVADLEQVEVEGEGGGIDDATDASIDLQESSSNEIEDDSDDEEGIEVELMEL